MTAALAIRETTPLIEWARTFRDTAEICVVLARTPFVPASLRVIVSGELDEEATAAQVTAAILTGQELGMPPMSALRSINVINGTPALTALAMRALVQRAGHKVWLQESTATRAIMRGQRLGDTAIQQSTWTMDRAKTMGLAGKPNWRAQPTSMLIARATAECCRLVGSDVLLGVPYSAEELDDGYASIEPPPESPESPTPPKRRTAQRAPMRIETVELPSPTGVGTEAVSVPVTDADGVGEGTGESPAQSPPDERAGDQEGPSEQPPGSALPPGISDGQMKALHAAFRDLRITDRADRLAMTNRIIGRDVESSTELTHAEASSVLDELSLLTARRTEWTPPDDEPFDE